MNKIPLGEQILPKQRDVADWLPCWQCLASARQGTDLLSCCFCSSTGANSWATCFTWAAGAAVLAAHCLWHLSQRRLTSEKQHFLNLVGNSEVFGVAFWLGQKPVFEKTEYLKLIYVSYTELPFGCSSFCAFCLVFLGTSHHGIAAPLPGQRPDAWILAM